MSSKNFLDKEGVKILWRELSLHDYPKNETLMAVIEAIDETKADIAALNDFYNKNEIDNYELITLSDIDEICGGVTEGGLMQNDVDELMAQLQ